METLTGSPFTLVVKAPNQEISDQTIECFFDWTVQKLKKHLSTVYPTNPNEWSQKIIYSGKLLQDNSLLKDVLSVTDVKDKYTVHLVCTPSPHARIKQAASPRSTKESVSARPSMSPSVTSSDGLRQRVPSQQQQQQQQQQPQPQPQQQSANISPNATLPSATWSSSSTGPFPLVPGMATQQQWIQQVYAQQMAAYMQYASMVAASSGIQTGWNQGYQMPSAWIQPSQVPAMRHPAEPVPAQAIPPPEVNQPQAAAPPAAPANNNNLQRMNVGGGQALDDEDGIRRDWLDWLFMLCRFGILLSIVYFYSSVNRFLVVAGAMFVMYLYQAGFFQLRRRQRVRPPVAPPQEAAPGREETLQDGGSDGPNDQLEESDSSTNTSDDGDGTEASAEPQEPPRPGVLATTWVFISTFFTSIIPQGPAQQFPAN